MLLRLKKRIWLNKRLLHKNCSVLSHISLNPPVWCRKLDGKHMSLWCHLCKILNVKWWQHTSKKFILEKSKLSVMYDMFTQRNLKWAIHLNRLEGCRLLKQILYSQLREESRKTGRPKIRHKDIIKRSLWFYELSFRQLAIPVQKSKELEKKLAGRHHLIRRIANRTRWEEGRRVYYGLFRSK